MSMYKNSRFSRDTSWGKLIDTYRVQMLERYTEILIDEYQQACENSDTKAMKRLSSKLSRELQKDLAKGNYISVKKYLAILEKMDEATIPMDFVHYLHEVSSMPENHHQLNDDLLETVEGLLLSKGITGD